MDNTVRMTLTAFLIPGKIKNQLLEIFRNFGGIQRHKYIFTKIYKYIQKAWVAVYTLKDRFRIISAFPV